MRYECIDKDCIPFLTNTKYKVGIIGSRDTPEDKIEYCKEIIRNELKKFDAYNSLLISGGSKGIDKLAEAIAEEMNYDIVVVKPNYKIYAKGAPLKRDIIIAQFSDYLIAIRNSKVPSKGTNYTIEQFKKLGKTNLKLCLI